MNPRLISWKADIICLQETKLELISNSVVRSLWGCQFLDLCYLLSSGAFGGILLMWDRSVVEKIEVCVGDYVVACSFRNIEDNSTRLLRGSSVLSSIFIEGFCGTNWLACLVGGICLGALVVISMSPTFPANDQDAFHPQ